MELKRIEAEYERLKSLSTFVLPVDKKLSLEAKLEWYITHIKRITVSNFKEYRERAITLLPQYEKLYFELTKKADFQAYFETKVTVRFTTKCNTEQKNKETLNEIYEKISEQIFNGQKLLLTPDIELIIDHVEPDEVIIMNDKGLIISKNK